MARVLERVSQRERHNKSNEYSKSHEKGKSKGKKGKGKGQGKEEKPPPNSSFAGHCRSCGKWGHRANECWQGYVQGIEEAPSAPSSSSSSTLRSTAITSSSAAKTAAMIQEVDEDESGWIFGMVGGSGTAGTIGKDEVWDELVLDSGSVSTACPYSWCADIPVNDKEKAYLQDIQQRRIPSHGSRVIPLELWGPEGNVPCMVKFDVADVADVAYPVVSLGKMIETGSTFSFNDYKCYMHKGNRRVEIFRKGRIFVLRMRRKWLTGSMVAPIDGPSRCGENEMDVTEDDKCADPGTAAAEAAVAVRTRVDEPGDDPSATPTA